MGSIDVVFVAHEALRSGAPMSLLRRLVWMREHTKLSFAVVLGDHGPLAQEFAEIAPVVLASDERAGDYFCRARLIYANSSWSHQFVDAAPRFQAPVVSHVFELRGLLSRVNPMLAGKRPIHYIADAEEVRDILIEDYPIRSSEVTVCKGFVPTAQIEAAAVRSRSVRNALPAPTSAMLVGAVGGVWPTKGPDLFVQVCDRIVNSDAAPPDVHFVWVGGPSYQVDELRQAVAARGLEHRLHLTGELKHPYGLMQAFDLQVLPSREDTFPSVLLEAGVLGRCVVAFDCSRGVRDLLADGRGVLVEAGHVDHMADEVVSLLRDEPRRTRAGLSLGAHVRDQYDIERRAPGVLSVIESFL